MENGMKIKPGKSKAISFTTAGVKDPIRYSLLKQGIPEAGSCKYLGIILRRVSWTDHVNYTVKKAWKALHFTMHILKKWNINNKSVAYMSLVHLILEYRTACWNPFSKGQINALDRVHKKVAKFANPTNESNWEMSVQCRRIACICALYEAYSGDLAWKAIGDRLQRPYHLSRVDHDWKIRNSRQRTEIRKYSFVNRTIQLWNKVPMNALGTFPSKPRTFRKRVRKVISEMKWREFWSEEEIRYIQEKGLECDKWSDVILKCRKSSIQGVPGGTCQTSGGCSLC